MSDDAPPSKRARTELGLPKVIFGTSSLGNLFSAPTHDEKKAVVEEIVKAMDVPVFDSAVRGGGSSGST